MDNGKDIVVPEVGDYFHYMKLKYGYIFKITGVRKYIIEYDIITDNTLFNKNKYPYEWQLGYSRFIELIKARHVRKISIEEVEGIKNQWIITKII